MAGLVGDPTSLLEVHETHPRLYPFVLTKTIACMYAYRVLSLHDTFARASPSAIVSFSSAESVNKKNSYSSKDTRISIPPGQTPDSTHPAPLDHKGQADSPPGQTVHPRPP